VPSETFDWILSIESPNSTIAPSTVHLTLDLLFTINQQFKLKIMEKKFPIPPFTMETALEKVQLGEDIWNSQDPEKIALAYTIDSEWRNRSQFINGREEIIKFLKGKWEKELDYKLRKELWAFTGNRIAVRFEYECRNANNEWMRAYGNENWEFDENGLMRKRWACINDVPIKEEDRRL
jgi:nuclear transport factor 2 (NTF2) superfamily protein